MNPQLNTWYLLSKIAAFVCACFMFLGIGLAAGKTGAVMDMAIAHDSAVTSVLNSLTKTMDTINRPCPGPKDKAVACGSLADFNRTLATARGTMGVVEVAGRHYDKQLTTIDGQELDIFTELHDTLHTSQVTLNEGTALLRATTETVKTVPPLVKQVQGTAAQATATLGSVQKVVSDPNIPQTLSALRDGSQATASAMHSVQATSVDVQKRVHIASQHSLIWNLFHAH